MMRFKLITSLSPALQEINGDGLEVTRIGIAGIARRMMFLRLSYPIHVFLKIAGCVSLLGSGISTT
jgi:hypothetical protein